MSQEFDSEVLDLVKQKGFYPDEYTSSFENKKKSKQFYNDYNSKKVKNDYNSIDNVKKISS